MKAKKFKIRLQTPKQTLDEFEKTWTLMQIGPNGKRTRVAQEHDGDLVLYFSDLSLVSKVLSAERLRLIQMVQEKKPTSVNQLATMLGRSQANVLKDVHYLAELGILDLKKIKIEGKKAESMQPQFRWTGFDIDLVKKKAS